MAKHRDDDYFKDTTMTFGEHLEELRTSLFKAILWLVAGIAIGLLVGDWVVALIKAPLSGALGTYYENKTVTEYAKWAKKRTDANQPVPYTTEQVADMVNEHHLVFDIRYMHLHQVWDEVTHAFPAVGKHAELPLPSPSESMGAEHLLPIFIWNPIADDDRINPTTLSAPEAFSIWFKAALVVGVVLSSPGVFYHIWSFVAAGLYPHEKKYVHIFLPFSLGLFLLGAATAYLLVFKPVLDFLFGFNQWLQLDPDPRISEWLGFVLFLPIGFGISFQLPLVMLFLERIGVFNVTAYIQKWRIAVLVIFVLSAILTPADPYSLLFMAVPLTGLYFGGVLLCHVASRRRVQVAEFA